MPDQTPSLAKLLSRRRLALADGTGFLLLETGGHLLLENGPIGITTKHTSTGYAGQTNGAAKT